MRNVRTSEYMIQLWPPSPKGTMGKSLCIPLVFRSSARGAWCLSAFLGIGLTRATRNQWYASQCLEPDLNAKEFKIRDESINKVWG